MSGVDRQLDRPPSIVDEEGATNEIPFPSFLMLSTRFALIKHPGFAVPSSWLLPLRRHSAINDRVSRLHSRAARWSQLEHMCMLCMLGLLVRRHTNPLMIQHMISCSSSVSAGGAVRQSRYAIVDRQFCSNPPPHPQQTHTCTS